MKIFGFIILLFGAVFSFGASKWVSLVRRTDAISDKEVLITKLVGLVIAAVGMVIVFLG